MRKGLPGKSTLILLTLVLVGMAAGCSAIADVVEHMIHEGVPPMVWEPTAEYYTIDQDLRFVVMSFNFHGQGGQWHCTLFYAVLAPLEMSGWQLTPGPVAVSDDQGPLGTAQAVPIESVGGVTLGALVLSPFGYTANSLKIAFATMVAKNLTTGEVKEIRGDWQLVPMRNQSTGYSGEGTTLGGRVWPEAGLTHQGTALRYVTDGGHRGFPSVVIGEQFWMSEPEPHDILVLVTSEGVSRVSADEYRQWGFTIYTPRMSSQLPSDINSP